VKTVLSRGFTQRNADEPNSSPSAFIRVHLRPIVFRPVWPPAGPYITQNPPQDPWGRAYVNNHPAEASSLRAGRQRTGSGPRMNTDKPNLVPSVCICVHLWPVVFGSGPRRQRARGFTLLEMIVATLIMAIAVVGLLSGISGAARNAARVRDYDRIAQLARVRMNDLMLDPALTASGSLGGRFNPAVTGGLDAGWEARESIFEMPPTPMPNQAALDRIELQVWWMSGAQRRTFTLEAFRERILKSDDLGAGGSQ